MSALWTLAQREFRAFLRSPLGYAILAVYSLASGLFLITLLYLFRENLLRSAQQAAMPIPQAAGPSVQVSVVTPYLVDTASLLLFVVPFITMRAIAEERRSRALELLVSYPLKIWQVVGGKFLGALLFSLLLLAVNVLHLAILALVSTPDLLPLAGGLAGLSLFAVALLAIGLFISTLAMGQVEAAVLTLGLFLVLAMAGASVRPGASAWIALFINLSPLYHFVTLGQGLLAPSAIFYFLAVTALFLGLAIRGVGLIKWRG
ncbi:MAG: ABC transporter permease subunit [Candidatus Eisenbacteria bacterium]|nr:ABC transporter permease subunit [Candidatus Eisenbacteria bacterium]